MNLFDLSALLCSRRESRRIRLLCSQNTRIGQMLRTSTFKDERDYLSRCSRFDSVLAADRRPRHSAIPFLGRANYLPLVAPSSKRIANGEMIECWQRKLHEILGSAYLDPSDEK